MNYLKGMFGLRIKEGKGRGDDYVIFSLFGKFKIREDNGKLMINPLLLSSYKN